jgi:hypothetical protein
MTPSHPEPTPGAGIKRQILSSRSLDPAYQAQSRLAQGTSVQQRARSIPDNRAAASGVNRF